MTKTRYQGDLPPGLAGGGGAGDVAGPASSTDNAVARFDGATGKLLQASTVLLADSGAVSGILSLTTSHATNYSVAKADSGTTHDNSGASGEIQALLPVIADLGVEFEFLVLVAQHHKIKARTGNTIRVAGVESADAGFIRSNVAGHSVRVKAAATDTWLVTSMMGTWLVDL